jgi:DNA (cytosine-5)-methyltransferase 1
MIGEEDMKRVDDCTAVDVFAGVGGLTHGFLLEGFSVAAGIDADGDCRYPYEYNNPNAKFLHKKVEELTADELSSLYPPDHVKILVGCAPCQPFSAYTRKKGKHSKWQLLYDFAKLIEAIEPDIISMENVPRLKSYDDGTVMNDFREVLERNDYHITCRPRVNAADYGVPQSRHRLILLASRYGEIDFLRPSHTPDRYRKVRDSIGYLEELEAGETSEIDSLHRAAGLSPLNLRRIKASKPGGTWEDWDEELRARCHSKSSGRTYKNVYGRMEWDDLSPTITTQCYGFGNGRFGHPEQDRAISMREAALLQTFPSDYRFFKPNGEYAIGTVSRWIGNAVPVNLARAIAKSIRLHLLKYRGWLQRTEPVMV